MDFFEFDPLEKELEDLPGLHRVAFAAACCERMVPNYSAFYRMYDWGDQGEMSSRTESYAKELIVPF
jgi:hypothetical protein